MLRSKSAIQKESDSVFERMLGLVTFDTSGWICEQPGSLEQPRIWRTPEGDGISLALCLGPEAFPPNLASVAGLREHFDSRWRQRDGKVIEASAEERAGGPVYSIVARIRRDPLSFSYVGTLLIPFENYGYMIVLHCEEHGVTGLREALAFNRRFQHVPVDTEEQMQTLVATLDPDHEIADEELPDHPLSRLHRHLVRITSSLAIDENLRSQPRPGLLPPG